MEDGIESMMTNDKYHGIERNSKKVFIIVPKDDSDLQDMKLTFSEDEAIDYSKFFPNSRVEIFIFKNNIHTSSRSYYKNGLIFKY